ncbi:MAG: YncE family protein [Phycisphaerae bacterium]
MFGYIWSKNLRLLILGGVVGVVCLAGAALQAQLGPMAGRSIDQGLGHATAPVGLRAGESGLGVSGMEQVGAMAGTSGLPPGFELPPLSPLVTGRFVNFEVPQVRPIALSDDGETIFVANAPNDALTVIHTILDVPPKDVPVGIGPGAVAVQPNTNSNLVWVTNFVSDNLSIVDVAAGKVVALIELGDEPADLAFDPLGTHAFVLIRGVLHTPDGVVAPVTPNVQEGHVLVIDTQTRQIVSRTYLDCNTPEDLVYDPSTDRIYVTAFFSGNRTTTVGHPVGLDFVFPPPISPPPLVPPPVVLGDVCTNGAATCTVVQPNLWVAQNFPETAGIFAAAVLLSPWPDDVASNGPPLPPTPLVERIVFGAGAQVPANGWQDIVDVLSNNGVPDPVMVQKMNAAFGITNAFAVITEMINDAVQTRDRDLMVLDASSPASPAGLAEITALSDVGTMLTGLALNPVSGQVLVTNIQGLNQIRLEPNLNGHFVDHEVVLIADPTNPSTVAPRDLHAGIPNFNDTSAFNPPAWAGSLADPADIVVHQNGETAYVAANGSSRVGVLRTATGGVLSVVDVAAGPTGLALDSAGNLLYVFSRVSQSVTVVDVSSGVNPVVRETIPLFNPEPPEIQFGRQFLYTSLQSNNGGSACAGCHPQAGLDHLAWDLGDPGGGPQPVPPNLNGVNHPLKGPMVTLSLQGLKNHNFLHWRSDKETFNDFNGAFAALMGGNQLSPEDMEAYRVFIETVVYPPSPFFNRNNSYKDPRALDGIDEYFTFCNGCHESSHDGAFLMAGTGDGGTFLVGAPFFLQKAEITQLRGMHKKLNSDQFNGVGLVHDGRDKRQATGNPLEEFIDFFFANRPDVTFQDRQDLLTFVTMFQSNVMSVVGWQILMVPPMSALSAASVQLNVMIAQHDKVPSHCDVVAKGIVSGAPRSYDLVTTTPEPTFQSDTDQLITLAALTASLGVGDQLVFTAVPPGSGPRGIDQDLDCVSDGVDLFPQANNTSDADFNGTVDLFDYAAMQTCFGGNLAGSVTAGCKVLDSDCDGDVDLVDYAVMESKLLGPGV